MIFTTGNQDRIVITYQPNSAAASVNEIISMDKGARVCARLSFGVALISLSAGFNEFFRVLADNPPVFIRHIFPALCIFEIEENREHALSVICEKANGLSGALGKDKTFSVQTRVLSENKDYKGFVNNGLCEYLSSKGFTPDILNPEQIISIIIKGNTVYMGVSSPEQSLSRFAGGEIRFKRETGTLSRAEFKLLEAFEVFGIPHDGKNKTALDLGAAPGGWSKALCECGYSVTAVDPANMNLKIRGITHIKTSAQNFFENADKKLLYDIITNDMKMDAFDSIDIMIKAKQFLKRGGIAVMTLKLPEKEQQKRTKKALSILKNHFNIAGARQLFHNRSEVTAAVIPR